MLSKLPLSSFDHSKLRELIDLVINEPEADAGAVRGHQIPYYAFRILDNGNAAITDKFFQSPPTETASETEENFELFDHLISFFKPKNQDQELNSVLAGYVSSILLKLLDKKKLIVLKRLYETENGDLIDSIAKYVGQSSIGQCFVKLLETENEKMSSELSQKVKDKKS